MNETIRKKINFDIKYRKQIEDGLYHVVTRDGREACILKWNANSKYPIIGTINTNGNEEPHSWTESGKTMDDDGYIESDLFILTDECILDAFEKKLAHFMQYTSVELESDENIKCIKEASEELLRLAKDKLWKDCKDCFNHFPKWTQVKGIVDKPTVITERGKYYLRMESLIIPIEELYNKLPVEQ